jgi:hypothetical protein
VVASGNGSSTGQSVRDTNTAVAIVRPISVECTITLSSPSDTDGNPNDNHVTLPNSGPVNFMVQVCNTGQATLSVALTGLPCAIPSVTLAAGQCTNVSCMVTVACPGTNYTLTVVGTAVATTDVPCVLDANGRAITTQPSTCRAVVECQLTFCTFTQGFYGNDKRAPLINTLLGPPFGNLVLGKPGRSLTIVQGDGLCVTTRMPSGGPAATLASGNNSFGAGCADGQNIKNGRWGNVLIGQTLALMLNVRFDTNGLGDLALSANLCTAVNPTILTALANLGLPQTVNGLIELANRGLGGQPTGGASLTDLVGAAGSINEGFDECKTCRPGASSVPSGDVSVPGESSAPNGSGDSDTVGNSSNVKPPVVKRHNNQLELSWTDAGLTLQSAPTPTGPFTDVPDAKTGYTNSFSGKQQFFRLKRD